MIRSLWVTIAWPQPVSHRLINANYICFVVVFASNWILNLEVESKAWRKMDQWDYAMEASKKRECLSYDQCILWFLSFSSLTNFFWVLLFFNFYNCGCIWFLPSLLHLFLIFSKILFISLNNIKWLSNSYKSIISE